MKSCRIAIGLAIAAATAAGCGGDAAGDGLAVDRSTFAEEDRLWPFAVDDGQLHCEDGLVYFQTPTGETYGLNGPAIESGEYAPPDPIWLDAPQADDEDGAGEADLSGKAPLDDVIELGEQEC